MPARHTSHSFPPACHLDDELDPFELCTRCRVPTSNLRQKGATVTQRMREEDRVRSLARTVIEMACEPRMEEVRKRWRDVNALRKPDRAPVWFRPVGCWGEILPTDTLQCRDPWLSRMEYGFLQTLYKRDAGDDTPVEPYFTVNAAFDVTPPNVWGLDIRRRNASVAGGSWAYDPPLKEESDFERLRVPVFRYNVAKTNERLDRMNDLLGDVAPVRLEAGPPLGATLGNAAADLRGLGQMMLDMVDRPGLFHRLMSYLRDAVLGSLDVVEQTGLVTPNNTGPMTTSDPIGSAGPDGRFSFRTCWCMANSQEFDGVSPAMWEEFCLAYQKPIFERFGLVGYGCCENLTHKIDGVLSIPNLRVFVCSAWTDLEVVRNKLNGQHCIMWRQKASDVVYGDASKVRQDLLEGARRLRGCPYQIVLRELQTLAGNLDRLRVWTQAAIEAAARFS